MSEHKEQPIGNTGQRGAAKVARIPVKIEPTVTPQRKPHWIRVRTPASPRISELKQILRDQNLHTVCEEASCPNLGECFSHGTATFMIMGDICTRRCPFCDVAHGKPNALDSEEPAKLAETVQAMGLKYVVVTSVDRDDLRDGGAAHFAACIQALRERAPETQIEVLVPDFRGRQARALEIIAETPPDVFNHNLETVPRLYRQARPGAGYQESLDLIRAFRKACPAVPAKSGIMLGLGETKDEVLAVLNDLRAHDCERLTLGQYLQPSRHHLPVDRYLEPTEFDHLAEQATALGFTHVASGPLVRSSYHADLQAAGQHVG